MHTRTLSEVCRGDALLKTIGARGGHGNRGAAKRLGAGTADSGRPAEHDHQSSSGLRPQRAADDLLHRSGHPRRRSRVWRPHPGQQLDQAAVDGLLVGGRAGVERAGAVSRVERHPEQPAAALARRRRPGDGVPQPVEQQQRQHVRFPGPSAVVRAPDAARRAIRARRLDHGDRRRVRRQAPQFSERRRRASRRQLLVHRSAVRRAVVRRSAGRGRRSDQCRRPVESAPGPVGRGRLDEARASDERVPRRSEGPRHPRGDRRSGARPERPRVLARLQAALRGEHGQRPWRRGAGREGRHARVRGRRRRRCRMGSASRTS